MTNKKTNIEFKKEVYNLVGNEYAFLDPYVNNHTKLRVKHNKCGNIYKVIPSSFLRGTRCPYCSANFNFKKTDKRFKQEVENLVGSEYTFLDTYVNSYTKLRVKHNKCGNTYEVTPSHFFNGTRCPHCFGAFKKTNAQFQQEVYDLVGNEYTFLDDYVNAHTKLKVKHNKCGKIYDVQPANFFSGQRCPHCSTTARKTDAQFKQEVFDLVGNEYTFLDSYVNNCTKIRVKHNECGNVYKVQPNGFLHGSRCPYCNGNAKKTGKQFAEEVAGLSQGEYVLVGTYVNSHIKVEIKHNKCGHIYKVKPYSFLEGFRCPYCNSPKGEVNINKILKSFGINYEYQKMFLDLKDTQPLSYDFYIPDQNILIEYQGRQHYQPVDYFGGEAQFKLQQKHDKMKADYAKAHHYHLIAVPYTEDTFSKIKKYLLQHGLSK